jgi:hypothetical protein
MIQCPRIGAALSLALIALLPQRAFAVCVDLGQPLCKLYQEYSVVFDGTVVSIEGIELDESKNGKLEPFPHRVVTFAVHRTWKGLIGDKVQLLQPGGRRRDGITVTVSNTLEVEAGVRYVIFANVGRGGVSCDQRMFSE